MGRKSASPERERTVEAVREAMFDQPEILTEELMRHTQEEFFKNIDFEKMIYSQWRTFTRQIIRKVRDDTNMPVAFNRPTQRGREYVNVDISENIEALEDLLRVLTSGRDARNAAIDKVKSRLEFSRDHMEKTKDIKVGEVVERIPPEGRE